MAECNANYEECDDEAHVLIKYVMRGLKQDASVCFDHLEEKFNQIEGMEDSYVVDFHLLKEGRIWKNGYEPRHLKEK